MPKLKVNQPEIVEMPTLTMAVVHTVGDPGEVGHRVFPALYGAVYALKFALKKQGVEYKVEPAARRAGSAGSTGSPCRATSGRRRGRSPFPTGTTELVQKDPETPVDDRDVGVRPIAQVLHVGTYAEEEPTIDAAPRLHRRAGLRDRRPSRGGVPLAARGEEAQDGHPLPGAQARIVGSGGGGDVSAAWRVWRPEAQRVALGLGREAQRFLGGAISTRLGSAASTSAVNVSKPQVMSPICTAYTMTSGTVPCSRAASRMLGSESPWLVCDRSDVIPASSGVKRNTEPGVSSAAIASTTTTGRTSMKWRASAMPSVDAATTSTPGPRSREASASATRTPTPSSPMSVFPMPMTQTRVTRHAFCPDSARGRLGVVAGHAHPVGDRSEEHGGRLYRAPRRARDTGG